MGIDVTATTISYSFAVVAQTQYNSCGIVCILKEKITKLSNLY